MTADRYQQEASVILQRVDDEQGQVIREAGTTMADAIARGGAVYVYESGHSMLPVIDIIPRFGRSIGFCPLLDSRAMRVNGLELGGPCERFRPDRLERYAQVLLDGYALTERDVLLLYTHIPADPASNEVAVEAKRRGLTVIAVASMTEVRAAATPDESCPQLSDVADIIVHTRVSPGGVPVDARGLNDTLPVSPPVVEIAISMALVTEVGAQLVARGLLMDELSSPNARGIGADENETIFEAFNRLPPRLEDDAL